MRAGFDPTAVGRELKVIVDVERNQSDRERCNEFEHLLAAFDEVVEAQRLFGSPDYFVRIAVADLQAFETLAIFRALAPQKRIPRQFPR